MPGDFSEIRAFGQSLRHGIPAMLDVIAEEVANEARRNARARGGRRFWVHDILNSIHVEDTQTGKVIGSTHAAAAHKQFGGIISAPGTGPGSLHRKYLTIPVGIARDRRWDTDKAQQEGWDLFPVMRGHKLLLLGTKETGTKRKRKSPPRLLFVLKKSVTQHAEPWFPHGAELEDAVERGIELYMKTLG